MSFYRIYKLFYLCYDYFLEIQTLSSTYSNKYLSNDICHFLNTWLTVHVSSTHTVQHKQIKTNQPIMAFTAVSSWPGVSDLALDRWYGNETRIAQRYTTLSKSGLAYSLVSRRASGQG